MNLRKTLLLASMAIAAVAALVAPVAASAAVWLHGEAPLEEHVELELAGTEVIQLSSGGVLICEVRATLTTEGGNMGEITAFEVVAEGCLGLGKEKLAGCSVEAVEPVGLPWTVDVNAEDLTATGMDVRRTLDPECPIGEIETTAPERTLVPYESLSSISGFEFNEPEGVVDVDGLETPAWTFGSFQIEGGVAGTYGIG